MTPFAATCETAESTAPLSVHMRSAGPSVGAALSRTEWKVKAVGIPSPVATRTMSQPKGETTPRCTCATSKPAPDIRLRT